MWSFKFQETAPNDYSESSDLWILRMLFDSNVPQMLVSRRNVRTFWITKFRKLSLHQGCKKTAMERPNWQLVLKDTIQERMVQRGKHSKTIKSFPGIVSRVLELRIDLVRGLWLLISAVFAFLSLRPGH